MHFVARLKLRPFNFVRPATDIHYIHHANWLCCQLGAREHFAVPRALNGLGLLKQLITDMWVKPGTFSALKRNGARQRFHYDLANCEVRAANLASLTFELKARTSGLRGWDLILRRNEWFQRFTVQQLSRLPTGRTYALFAYSYAALRVFEFARSRGWKTILGQIDPGAADEKILLGQNGDCSFQPAPKLYWQQWRKECELADAIVVNSSWSREALISEGVPAEKLRLVPLAIDTADSPEEFRRTYPQAFSVTRPLRVLFLGQIASRKGARFLFEAIDLLREQPVEFWFVGPRQMQIPADLKNNSRVHWVGRIGRNEVDRYYKKADVLVFPTLSDGFGLTQLEAQSWKLPIVASTRCGEVVHDGQNGLLLEEISSRTIAEALLRLFRSPDLLQRMSERSHVASEFTLQSLAASLASL